MRKLLGAGFLSLVLASCGATIPTQNAEIGDTTEPNLSAQAVVDCNASSAVNLSMIADSFISKCRKASIRQVFPGQHYSDTVLSIKNGSSASQKTAWKLLNDNRFKK